MSHECVGHVATMNALTEPKFDPSVRPGGVYHCDRVERDPNPRGRTQIVFVQWRSGAPSMGGGCTEGGGCTDPNPSMLVRNMRSKISSRANFFLKK